jgi:hypothetical protein
MNPKNVFEEVSSLKYVFEFYFLFFNMYNFFVSIIVESDSNKINNQFDEHANEELFSFDLVQAKWKHD